MKRTFGCAHVILWAAACGCGGDDGEPSETVGASTNADGGTSEVGSSDDAGTSSDAGGSTELPAVLTLSGSAWPEDVLAVDDRLFASNFVLGGIQVIDLGDPSAGSTEFVPAATDDRTSWWGMKADPVRNTLIVVANAPYAFDGNVTAPGEVRAYDLDDGEPVIGHQIALRRPAQRSQSESKRAHLTDVRGPVLGPRIVLHELGMKVSVHRPFVVVDEDTVHRGPHEFDVVALGRSEHLVPPIDSVHDEVSREQ